MTSRPSVFCRRRAVAGLAVAASLLLTTACNNGGSSPGATPVTEAPSASVASTPTPTPSPTPSYKPADASGRAQNVPVPVLPEEAKAETKEGLEAFARYWFAQLNFAYETGRLGGLDSVTAPDCAFCTNITRALATNYEGDRWLAGGRIETPSISTTYTPQADGDYQIIVQVQQASITYHRAGGTEFRTSTPPSDTGNVMLAAFKNGQWRLTGLHPIR
jgi:ketosteroid isomerase-like protein